MAFTFDQKMSTPYNSKLPEEDWNIFHKVLLDFLHVKDPAKIQIRKVPERIRDHEFMNEIRSYQNTGKDKHLDHAGRILCPAAKKKFDWYLPLTK